MITVCLFLSLSANGLYFTSTIPDAGAEPRIFIVGLNSTSTIRNSTYENSTLGIQIEYPTNWKPFEKTSAATSATVVEFIPFVESEHDPLTPFFSISIEDLEKVKALQNVENESASGIDSNNSTLNVLTERNLELAKSLPDFELVKLNSTSILSGIPAYNMEYTFADPGSPLLPLFESMNIWAVKDDKAYTISYTAPEPEFSNHLQTIQNMIDSFMIRKNN
jgi:PsbP